MSGNEILQRLIVKTFTWLLARFVPHPPSKNVERYPFRFWLTQPPSSLLNPAHLDEDNLLICLALGKNLLHHGILKLAGSMLCPFRAYRQPHVE